MSEYKPYQKLIEPPGGRISTRAFLNKHMPITCDGCGQKIKTGDYMQGCYYCNNIFCEACIKNLTWQHHILSCKGQDFEE